MTLNRIFFGGWRKFRKYTFTPINILVNIVVFFFRELFLGHENANNYLKKVSQPSIVPILKLKGAKIGKNCNIQSGITIHNCRDFYGLVIGNNCHIGKNLFLDLRGNVTIEKNVVISMNNTIITHIDMNKSDLRKIYPAVNNNTIIKSNVYLGTNCCLLMGVTIGTSSIIGAQSLVVKNVEENAIYAGSPAVKIKDIDGI